MWWPFGRKDENAELSKEIKPELLGFFEEQTPNDKAKSIFEITPQQQRVNSILQKYSKDEYDYAFDRYKQTEKIQKVAMINCAELQEKVLQCFRGYSLTATNSQCKEEITKVSSCMEIQAKALKKLYYDDCVGVEQCDKMRYIVDKLFTENFGQFGDELHNEESKQKFNEDLNGVFYKIWK